MKLQAVIELSLVYLMNIVFQKSGLEQAFQPKTKLYDAMGASVFGNPESNNWWQMKLLSFLNLTDQFFLKKSMQVSA